MSAQREQRALGIDHLATDFHLFIEIHETIHQFRVVAVLLGHTAEVSRVIRHDFGIHGFRNFLPTASHRRSGSNRTDGSHEDFFGAEGDQRTGRARIGIHKGVGGNRTLGEHLHDFLSRLEITAGRVHVQNNSRSRNSLGIFQSPPEEKKLRFAHRALDRKDNHRACGY